MEKIVIDARMIHHSGIGVYLTNIIKRFENCNNYIITLLVFKRDKNIFGNKFNYLVINSDIYSIKEIFEIPFKIPKCDVFWTPHFNVPILPIRAKKRVVTVHDIYHLIYIKELNLVKRIYSVFFYRAAFRLSDTIITVSNFSKSEIQKYHSNPNNIKVIPNGYDFKPFSNNKIREIKKDCILFVGNIKRHKNIKNLILAFQKANKNSSDLKELRLIIIGRAEKDIYFEELMELININDKIVITGYVTRKELVNFYNRALAFVLPSFYEGFGIPILEAFYFKVPVIAAKAASLPEVAGEAAEYFNPDDVNDLTEKLIKVLSSEDLRRSLRYKGSDRLSLFSWDQSFESHIKIFENV